MISQHIYNSIAFTIFIGIIVLAIFPNSLPRLISRYLLGDYGVEHSFSSSADDDRISEEMVSNKAQLEGVFRG